MCVCMCVCSICTVLVCAHLVQKAEKRCDLFVETGLGKPFPVGADWNCWVGFLFSHVLFKLLVESVHQFEHFLSDVISALFSVKLWPRHE